jgi:purine-binding chemotaxis protein CheW
VCIAQEELPPWQFLALPPQIYCVTDGAAPRGILQVESQAMNQAVTSVQDESTDSSVGQFENSGRASDSAGSVQFVSFAIGDDQYGVDIMAVREIKGWSDITHLPKQPDYVRGVLNLRGVIVPIVDLRCRFDQGFTEATPLHVVIIVQIANRQVGLLADRVLDIVAFEPSQVQPVPKVAQSARADFLSGLVTIENVMLALIDLPNLLTTSENETSETAAVH